jgi:methyltransferase (TIGR00027 family)
MALFRAMETANAGGKRLFADSLAASFLRPSLKLALHLASLPVVGKGIPKFIDHHWPGARTSGVARTRLIDDLMMEAFQSGLEQVVILGAGFDARPYRLVCPRTTRFYEVDQPSTSRTKRRMIAERLGALPPDVAFVEVDFDRQELGPALTHAGFRQRQPTFFLWEGVTNYLMENAVDSTLRWIGSSLPPSQLVFTYVDKDVIDAPASFTGTQRLGRTLARSGERWTFGLHPAEIPAYLAARGLELIGDLGAADYRTRYLGSPGVGYEFYRVAIARVAGGHRESEVRSPGSGVGGRETMNV